MDETYEILLWIGIPIWIFDVENSCVVWANNPALQHWNAQSLEELQSRDMSTDMSESVRKRLKQYQLDCAIKNRVYEEDWTLYPNGTPHTSRMGISGVDLSDGRKGLLVQVLSDLADSTSGTLRSMQALMHTSAMIWLFDEDLKLVYTNPAARSIATPGSQCLGDLIAHDSDLDRVLNSLETESSCDLELEVVTADGNRWHALNLQNSPDPVSGCKTIIVSSTDVTARRKIEAQAQYRARTDALTGLPNRPALLDELGARIEQAQANASNFALLFMDLDRFKLVNDSLGHSVGDSLLVEFSRLLEQQVSDADLVARLSGDEFVVLLSDAENDDYTIKICEAISQATTSLLKIEGHHLRVSTSIGVCRYPEHGNSVSELMQHADIAMYAAKSIGCGYRYFEPAMGSSQLDRLSMESDLAGALRDDQFTLFYQPKVDSQTFRVTGMEALIRWIHPERGMVNPMEFIPVAEETGMIYKIGAWVLEQAMIDQVRWSELGLDISVAVNISPKQFNAFDFVGRIEHLIKQTGIAPDRLNLEVTESMLITDSDRVSKLLDSLAAYGIQVSIDDFGTGYSNLANLQTYPVSCLKIDRAFVKSEQYDLLEVILQMGKILGMRVVAEGVETLEQVRWLQSHSCDLLQGFFFSKPQPFDDIVEFVRTFDPADLQLSELQRDSDRLGKVA